jgi:hypothetical protein
VGPPETPATDSSATVPHDAAKTFAWSLEPVRDPATLQSVIELDRAAFTMPWRPEMFVRAARSSEFRLLTLRATGDSRIGGFICYRIASELEIATLAVRQDVSVRRTAS